VIELFTGLGFMAGPPIGGLLYQVRFTTANTLRDEIFTDFGPIREIKSAKFDIFFLSLRKEDQNGQKTFV